MISKAFWCHFQPFKFQICRNQCWLIGLQTNGKWPIYLMTILVFNIHAYWRFFPRFCHFDTLFGSLLFWVAKIDVSECRFVENAPFSPSLLYFGPLENSLDFKSFWCNFFFRLTKPNLGSLSSRLTNYGWVPPFIFVTFFFFFWLIFQV